MMGNFATFAIFVVNKANGISTYCTRSANAWRVNGNVILLMKV